MTNFTHRRFSAGQATTSDLADLVGDAVRACNLELRSFGGHQRFAGRIRTVACGEDNVLVRDALSSPGDADVLVVDAGGSTRVAIVGDEIAALGAANGWAGVIVFGGIRDVHLLSQIPLGVRALASNPRKSTKDGTGEVDVDVTFGDVTFRPGETVYADEDGIVVVDQPVD